MLSPLLVGCAVLLTNRLVAPRRDPANENAVEGLLKIVGWVLVVVGLLGNLALMMAPLSIVWIPVLIIGWTFIELKRRRVLQQALLETMAVSAERRLPLSPAVRAFAEDVGGRFGRRAAELATLLEVGETLPDALGQVDGLMPRDAMPSVRVGYRSGALARGLAQAAAMDDRQKELWGPFAAKMLYAAGLPCIACGSVLFTLVFVVRLYHQVLKSLGDPPLPRLTLALLQLSDYLEVGWPFLALVAGIFVFLFLYGVLRYLGVPLLDLPGTGHMLRRQHTAAILENLALAVEHGHSLYGTIHALGKCYPKKAIRNKLNCVATDIENGIAWCESLRHRGLVGEADFAVLQSAERLGNLPWAMEETAKSNRRRLALRLKVLMQLLFPPVVLGFGAIVLFMVVAVFLPLLTIMRCWSNP
jgi:protein transport protein HofC